MGVAAALILTGCQVKVDGKTPGQIMSNNLPGGIVVDRSHVGHGESSNHTTAWTLCIKDARSKTSITVCRTVPEATYHKYTLGKCYPGDKNHQGDALGHALENCIASKS